MRTAGLLLIALFGLFSIFGLVGIMKAHSSGNMSNCHSGSGESGLCNMSTNQHIANWQSIMTTLAPVGGSFAWLFLLFTVVLSFLFIFGTYTAFGYELAIFKEPPTADYLRIQFSRGILNPKLH